MPARYVRQTARCRDDTTNVGPLRERGGEKERERERGFCVGRGGFTTATIVRQRHGTGYKVVACSKRGHSVVETSRRRYQERKIQEEKKRETFTSFFWDEDTKSDDTPVYTRYKLAFPNSRVTFRLDFLSRAEIPSRG